MSSFQPLFLASSVLLSQQSCVIAGGKKRRTLRWLELNATQMMQQQPAQAQLMMNVTVPEGMEPLSQIILATSFPRLHDTLAALSRSLTYPSSRHPCVAAATQLASMHALVGVPVDTTGDGVADSMEFDTTECWKIDHGVCWRRRPSG